jgi:hypothetical protein
MSIFEVFLAGAGAAVVMAAFMLGVGYWCSGKAIFGTEGHKSSEFKLVLVMIAFLMGTSFGAVVTGMDSRSYAIMFAPSFVALCWLVGRYATGRAQIKTAKGLIPVAPKV